MKKKRMKVGLFIDNYYPNIDGVTMVVDNLARCLTKYADVVVVCPYIDGCDDKGFPYKVIRLKSLKVPFTSYKIVDVFCNKSELINEEFDIIHIHSPFILGRIGINLAKKLNIPCISTLHTRFDFEFKRFVKNGAIAKKVAGVLIKSLNKCDLCTVVNDPLVLEARNYGYKGRIRIVYNGTDLKPAIFKGIKKNMINEMFNLKEEDKVMIFVGRIIDIKNIFFIMDALKLLKDDNFSFKMIFVGEGPDYEKLIDRVKEYNLEDDVILTGKITDRKLLSYIYRRSDLLLFPSLFDTSSLVRIEAAVNMTPGLFIGESMVGSTITDGVDGYLSELDVNLYKNKIISIFNNESELKKVSRNAKKNLGVSWSEIIKKYYKIYNEEISIKKDC